MLINDRRYKVRINRVWISKDGDGRYNTPEELRKKLKRFNLIIFKVMLIEQVWKRVY